jgi:aspartate kinase
MIVMKFGGTSVESREAIERVAEIVRLHSPRRPIVVVSAMGKTTNKLLAMASTAAAGNLIDAVTAWEQLRDYHLREAAGTEIVSEVEAQFDDLKELLGALSILRELSPRASDAIAAFGERISSLIVFSIFNLVGIQAMQLDSRRVILTDGRHTQATPLFSKTNGELGRLLPDMCRTFVVVMGGFIASTEDGVTTTLGRGGSDYTAAIVGAAIGAEEIQIWTDVDGMLTCDPTILADGYRVKTCSFAEAAELAYFGAKVLHPATVLPAIEKNIPVRILNSRRPESEGTLIVAEAPPSADPIRSIACKRNITLVNIVSTRMLMAHGFLRRIFEVFDRFETPVDMLATSEVSVSLTIDNTRSLDAIRAELETFAEVSIEANHAIVCLVGENIRRVPAVAARVFCALKDIPVRMVSQGASLLNISLVIPAADVARAVESLHWEFFHHPDPSAFERTAK